MADKKTPSPEHYAKHYPKVLQCAGLGDFDDRATEFDAIIRAIFNSYWASVEQLTVVGYREVLEAAQFDRGWGKALQTHVGHDGNEIRVTIRQIFESVDKEEPLLLEHETPEK